MAGGVYADTSFLMSLLVGDVHSERAREEVIALGKPLVTSELVELEYVNGVRQRVFRGEMSEQQALAAEKEFFAWKKAGRLVQGQGLGPEIWKSAVQLSREHTAHVGARSLDVLHVAFAVAGEAELFCSFDQKQRALASAEGLEVSP